MIFQSLCFFKNKNTTAMFSKLFNAINVIILEYLWNEAYLVRIVQFSSNLLKKKAGKK